MLNSKMIAIEIPTNYRVAHCKKKVNALSWACLSGMREVCKYLKQPYHHLYRHLSARELIAAECLLWENVSLKKAKGHRHIHTHNSDK